MQHVALGDLEFPSTAELRPLLELFKEMRCLLDHLELDSTIFRSDHASNYLILKGTLSKDKQKLLDIVQTAIKNPDAVPLREEWQRGL